MSSRVCCTSESASLRSMSNSFSGNAALNATSVRRSSARSKCFAGTVICQSNTSDDTDGEMLPPISSAAWAISDAVRVPVPLTDVRAINPVIPALSAFSSCTPPRPPIAIVTSGMFDFCLMTARPPLSSAYRWTPASILLRMRPHVVHIQCKRRGGLRHVRKNGGAVRGQLLLGNPLHIFAGRAHERVEISPAELPFSQFGPVGDEARLSFHCLEAPLHARLRHALRATDV